MGPVPAKFEIALATWQNDRSSTDCDGLMPARDLSAVHADFDDRSADVSIPAHVWSTNACGNKDQAHAPGEDA